MMSDACPPSLSARPARITQRCAMQRAKGRVEVGFGTRGLRHLYQSGCAKALFPRNFQPVPEAVFINTSGGVTGGDHLEYRVDVDEDSALSVTTQAAERVYRTNSGNARITNNLTLAERGHLEWLPQETILFEGSALKRRLNVAMAESATFLGLETIVLGRKAMGERLENATLCDYWRVRRGRGLVYGDGLRLDAAGDRLASNATLNGKRALSTLVYMAPDAEQRLDQARQLLSFADVEAAASAWNGILSARFLADDAQPLRAALILFLVRFRGRDLPRLWHM